MPRIKKSKKTPKPAINTNALPDIIFMLLFFFMVVTVMRQDQLLVKVKIPNASELNKLKNRSLINHIYIGKAIDQQHDAVRIQLQDAFVPIERIQHAIKTLVTSKEKHLQTQLSTALKIDEAVEMGIVNDVKIALRKEGQLKLSYVANTREN